MKIWNTLFLFIGALIAPLLTFSHADLAPANENLFEKQAHASRNSLSKYRIRRAPDSRLRRRGIPLFTSIPDNLEAGTDATLLANNFPLKSIDPLDFYEGSNVYAITYFKTFDSIVIYIILGLQ